MTWLDIQIRFSRRKTKNCGKNISCSHRTLLTQQYAWNHSEKCGHKWIKCWTDSWCNNGIFAGSWSCITPPKPKHTHHCASKYVKVARRKSVRLYVGEAVMIECRKQEERRRYRKLKHILMVSWARTAEIYCWICGSLTAFTETLHGAQEMNGCVQNSLI